MNYQPFLSYLDSWYSTLPAVSLSSLLKDFRSEQTALLSVDVLNGFCKEGNLASPRVASIVEPIVRLFKLAEQEGMNHYVLLQDCHQHNSKEFLIYPPHCIEYTDEAKTVSELVELPDAYKFKIFSKRTINPGLDKNFQHWLSENPSIKQFLVVGDCTDICVYLLSVFLKTWSVQQDTVFQIVIPANCVDTFDIPVVENSGTVPHPGELLHRIFLYHMHLNGMKIVSAIQ
jgi:hypothetical protein